MLTVTGVNGKLTQILTRFLPLGQFLSGTNNEIICLEAVMIANKLSEYFFQIQAKHIFPQFWESDPKTKDIFYVLNLSESNLPSAMRKKHHGDFILKNWILHSTLTKAKKWDAAKGKLNLWMDVSNFDT